MATNDSTITLPDFVIDRDQRAHAAGVVIETRKFRPDGELYSCYRGSVDRLTASGIITDPERVKRLRRPDSYCTSYIFNPRDATVTLAKAGPDEWRVRVRELLPVDHAEMGGGIKVYWFEHGFNCDYRWPCKLFVAPNSKALIDAGIVTPEIIEQTWERLPIYNGETHKIESPVVRRFTQRANGIAVFEICPYALEKAAQLERDKDKFDFTSVDAFRRFLGNYVAGQIDVILDGFSRVETRSGEIYELPESSRKAIEAAGANVRQAIENMRINVRKVVAARHDTKALSKIPAAKADGKFQNFMQRVIPS